MTARFLLLTRKAQNRVLRLQFAKSHRHRSVSTPWPQHSNFYPTKQNRQKPVGKLNVHQVVKLVIRVWRQLKLMLSWAVAGWKRVSWSGESRFQLRHADVRARLCRKPREAMNPLCQTGTLLGHNQPQLHHHHLHVEFPSSGLGSISIWLCLGLPDCVCSIEIW